MKVNGDGTVTDHATGLMWRQNSPYRMIWDDLEDYCRGLNFAGYTDWRCPTIEELKSLVNNTELFHDTSSERYWSITPHHGYNEGYAWGINFFDGSLFGQMKQFAYYVRPVRSITNAKSPAKEYVKSFCEAGTKSFVELYGDSYIVSKQRADEFSRNYQIIFDRMKLLESQLEESLAMNTELREEIKRLKKMKFFYSRSRKRMGGK